MQAVKEGIILTRDGKSKLGWNPWKSRVLRLVEDRIIILKEDATTQIGTFILWKCTVQIETSSGRDHTFAVKGDDDFKLFAAGNANEYTEWLELINKYKSASTADGASSPPVPTASQSPNLSTSRPSSPSLSPATAGSPVGSPSLGPQIKPRRGSLVLNAKKNVTGRFATSHMGKEFFRKIVDEEVRNTIDTFKCILVNVFGNEKAEELENDIIKLVIKGHMALENKIISQDDFIPSNLLVKKVFYLLTATYRMDLVKQEAHVIEILNRVARIMKEIEQLLSKMMEIVMTAKNHSKIADLFSMLGTVDFLRSVYSNAAVRPALSSLNDYMCRYLAENA